jgi:hypothetical protein
MKYLMVSCKEATFLMAKKEEGKLSLIEKMQLSVHTSMCSICKLFKKQDSKIREESRHIYAENSLSTLAKERIEKILKEQAG